MMVVGITMVKDEVDIIETTLLHMGSQVDALIIADNMSTDGTAEIVTDIAYQIGDSCHVVMDTEVGYNQAKKMTRLARLAHDIYNASWVVPFDADEIWMNLGPESIKDVLTHTHPSKQVVKAALFDYVATSLDDDRQPDPVQRLQWRRRMAAPLPKVACRWNPALKIGMGNHDASYSTYQAEGDTLLTIGHFPYRSPEQVINKIRNGAAAYAATDLPEIYGAHWRGWGRILDEQGEDAIVDLFHKWHWREDPTTIHTIDGEDQPPLVHLPIGPIVHV